MSEHVLKDAYRQIKDGVLAMRYRPGQKLSEAKLATELGVGRSPVRSALARLERDGWVRVRPQQGTFVRKFSAADIAAMSELRLLLEGHAAQAAAQTVTATELGQVRTMFEALKLKGAERHFEEFLVLDDMFHGLVYRAAGNPLVTEILNNLRDQIRWVRAFNAATPGRVDASFAEMERVLAALERRDGEAAAQAMRQHIGNIAISYRETPNKISTQNDQLA